MRNNIIKKSELYRLWHAQGVSKKEIDKYWDKIRDQLLDEAVARSRARQSDTDDQIAAE